ncbi:MAG: PAS domain S-box protein, partial [Planctomycetes bacterium]|nr:PAS domain S-box protein [Planctomycetota bacterium]
EELSIYREMLQSLEDVVFIHDPEGKLLYLSPAAEPWTGYAPADAPSLNFASLLPPEFLAEAVRRTERQTRHEPVEQPWDVQVLTKGGQRRWAQIRTRPAYDREGRLVRVYGVARDIQARKEMEEALRRHTEELEALVEERARGLKESEERFRETAELLPAIVFEVDAGGHLLFTNRAAYEILRAEHGGLLGRNVFEFVAPADRDRALDNARRVLAGDLVGLQEYLCVRTDGSSFPGMLRSAPIVRAGRTAGLRGFVIDVSEKKQLEERFFRAQKLEAVGTLAGGVAHDFNNLLMGIQGRIDLLRMEGPLAPGQEEHLREMAEHVRSAASLTRQLLGFAGRGKVSVEALDLNEVLGKTAQWFGRARKEIVLRLDLQEALWPVEADRGQIEQVLMNLLLNAWQAMPGGGEVFLATGNTALGPEHTGAFDAEPGRYVRVSVADSGEGMDEATRSHLFEPFFSTKGVGKGTGLGLASSWGIVRNHKGFIAARSEKGKGATFEVFLPAAERAARRAHTPPAQAVRGSGTVLLVDDEETILGVVKPLLERMGYRVLAARSGAEALEVQGGRRDGIDLVLLDLVMPGLNGRETAKRLRAVDPSVRILVATGYGADEAALNLADVPVSGVIVKPYDAGRLSEAIRKALEKP